MTYTKKETYREAREQAMASSKKVHLNFVLDNALEEIVRNQAIADRRTIGFVLRDAVRYWAKHNGLLPEPEKTSRT